jgi:opacity protein-like surface antigen
MKLYARGLQFILLMALLASHALAADSEELRERLERLQKSLQTASTEETETELEKKLQMLKELLKREGVPEEERKGLEEKLRMLKEQLRPEEKPVIVEEAPIPPSKERFFIEGRYWLAYIEGADKEVASLYNMETKQPLGSTLDTSFGPSDAFILSAGYKHANGRTTFVRLWHLESTDSLHRSATPSIGISGTEGSDYYYQNINQWGTTTFAVKGVERVDADSNLRGTSLDIVHSTPIGRGNEREFGVSLGLRYSEVDSDYSITYSSATSPLYHIKSDVENTLLGPVFGLYWNGQIYQRLRLHAMIDVSLAWDHVRAERFEYDDTISKTAVDARQSHDLAVTALGGEIGMRYPLEKGFTLSLDYKGAYFGGLPFELKTKESTFIETLDLLKRDILFHGLTAGVSYSF